MIRDEVQAYSDGTVARVRVRSVPPSDRFPEGVKYAFHYGVAGAAEPIVRFDNHHGHDELHVGATTYDLDDVRLQECYRAWRAALPESKRGDW